MIKNCLLAFRSRKNNEYEEVSALRAGFASAGYFFDRVSFVAYDSAEEIVRAIKDGKENYDNLIISCPHNMDGTLKEFIGPLYSSAFDGYGILESEGKSVFIVYSDYENSLTIEKIKDILQSKYGVSYERFYIRTIGAPIAEINSAISEALGICPDLSFNVSEKFGDCRLETIYKGDVEKSLIDAVLRTMLNKLNEYVYALDDISIEERLFYLLKLRHMKISVAESFTGGGVGNTLVKLPGISEVFVEGLNTYSNESKKIRLGVKDFTLGKYGAVSEETAYEMAEGLLRSGSCDVAIATTGIAGPKSDSSSKPVGLIYISVGTSEGIKVNKYNLNGDRNNITQTAIKLALFLAYKTLK